MLSVPLPTSVPEACFQHFGRKFPALHPCRLPYPSPVFRILNGSFMPCSPADFRTQAPFSAFWTEVSCPVPLLQTIYNTEKDPSFGRGLCMEVMGGKLRPRGSPAARRLSSPLTSHDTGVTFSLHPYTEPPLILATRRLGVRSLRINSNRKRPPVGGRFCWS